MTSSRSYPAGAARRFPSTRYSVLEAARATDPAARRQAWDDLVAGYWAPVCGYLRWQCGVEAEDARDMTQEFFTTAFDRGTFDRYDPARAHFRSYLRLCLDGFAANHRKAAARLKRGGGRPQVSLSLSAPADSFPGSPAELGERSVRGMRGGGGPGSAAALGRLHDASPDPEEVFHREWVRGLFALAVADLRRHCQATGRAVQYQVFARYDLGTPAPPGTAEPDPPGEPRGGFTLDFDSATPAPQSSYRLSLRASTALAHEYDRKGYSSFQANLWQHSLAAYMVAAILPPAKHLRSITVDIAGFLHSECKHLLLDGIPRLYALGLDALDKFTHPHLYSICQRGMRWVWRYPIYHLCSLGTKYNSIHNHADFLVAPCAVSLAFPAFFYLVLPPSLDQVHAP